MDFYVCYTVSGTYTTVNYGYSTSGWGDLLTSYAGATVQVATAATAVAGIIVSSITTGKSNGFWGQKWIKI